MFSYFFSKKEKSLREIIQERSIEGVWPAQLNSAVQQFMKNPNFYHDCLGDYYFYQHLSLTNSDQLSKHTQECFNELKKNRLTIFACDKIIWRLERGLSENYSHDGHLKRSDFEKMLDEIPRKIDEKEQSLAELRASITSLEAVVDRGVEDNNNNNENILSDLKKTEQIWREELRDLNAKRMNVPISIHLVSVKTMREEAIKEIERLSRDIQINIDDNELNLMFDLLMTTDIKHFELTHHFLRNKCNRTIAGKSSHLVMEAFHQSHKEGRKFYQQHDLTAKLLDIFTSINSIAGLRESLFTPWQGMEKMSLQKMEQAKSAYFSGESFCIINGAQIDFQLDNEKLPGIEAYLNLLNKLGKIIEDFLSLLHAIDINISVKKANLLEKKNASADLVVNQNEMREAITAIIRTVMSAKDDLDDEILLFAKLVYKNTANDSQTHHISDSLKTMFSFRHSQQ